MDSLLLHYNSNYSKYAARLPIEIEHARFPILPHVGRLNEVIFSPQTRFSVDFLFPTEFRKSEASAC